MSRYLLPLFVIAISLNWTLSILAQTSASTSNDAIRVTVTLNADGSRTTYQYDNAKHEAIATHGGHRWQDARESCLSHR
jgi:hypothetical protein